MTQAALARLAGTSQSNLARIELGDRSATLGSLTKVAGALRLSVSELLAETSSVQAPPRSEKLWFRVCARLRDRDERFLRGVEHLIRALDAARA